VSAAGVSPPASLPLPAPVSNGNGDAETPARPPVPPPPAAAVRRNRAPELEATETVPDPIEVPVAVPDPLPSRPVEARTAERGWAEEQLAVARSKVALKLHDQALGTLQSMKRVTSAKMRLPRTSSWRRGTPNTRARRRR
jgi:hypothetical protein